MKLIGADVAPLRTPAGRATVRPSTAERKETGMAKKAKKDDKKGPKKGK
jgi:hypothetical protein